MQDAPHGQTHLTNPYSPPFTQWIFKSTMESIGCIVAIPEKECCVETFFEENLVTINLGPHREANKIRI